MLRDPSTSWVAAELMPSPPARQLGWRLLYGAVASSLFERYCLDPWQPSWILGAEVDNF